jgi:hypothetical protein
MNREKEKGRTIGVTGMTGDAAAEAVGNGRRTGLKYGRAITVQAAHEIS